VSDLGYFAGTVMPASVFYRGSLAVLAIVGFYTGFLNYESIVGTSSIRPAWWIVTLSLLALPLALSPNAWRRILATPLTGWCVFYAVVTIMWFMASSQSDMALNELIARLLSTAFLGVLVVVFADRRVGESKMSRSIVLEALWKVWLIRAAHWRPGR